jgi:hypothetical protein
MRPSTTARRSSHVKKASLEAARPPPGHAPVDRSFDPAAMLASKGWFIKDWRHAPQYRIKTPHCQKSPNATELAFVLVTEFTRNNGSVSTIIISGLADET